MSAVEKDYKQSQAKDLFLKGFALENIEAIIGVSVKTLRAWRELSDWDSIKDLQMIRPSEIKNMILQYIQDLKDGKTPRYKADDLSKIAAAFDRLNDKKKQAVYTMESLDGFSGFLMEEAGALSGKKREDLLEVLKLVRPHFDRYVTKLLTDD